MQGSMPAARRSTDEVSGRGDPEEYAKRWMEKEHPSRSPRLRQASASACRWRVSAAVEVAWRILGGGPTLHAARRQRLPGSGQKSRRSLGETRTRRHGATRRPHYATPKPLRPPNLAVLRVLRDCSESLPSAICGTRAESRLDKHAQKQTPGANTELVRADLAGPRQPSTPYCLDAGFRCRGAFDRQAARTSAQSAMPAGVKSQPMT